MRRQAQGAVGLGAWQVSDKLDLLDAEAVMLSYGYQDEGEIGFTLRTLPDGDIRLIGPSLDIDLVIKVCRTLADSLEARRYSGSVRTN